MFRSKKMLLARQLAITLLTLLALSGLLNALATQSWAQLGQLGQTGAPPLSTRLETADVDGKLLGLFWITPKAGVHFYADDPGDSGKPLKLSATLPGPDNRPQPAQVFFPPAKRKPDTFDSSAMVNVYEGETPLFIDLSALGPPATATGAIQTRLDLLACDDKACYPVVIQEDRPVSPALLIPAETAGKAPWRQKYQAALLRAASEPPSQPLKNELPEATPSTLSATGLAAWNLAPRFHQPGLEVRSILKALPLAFLAGLILNCMPCVLPVISLKIFSAVSGQAHGGAPGESGDAGRRARLALFRRKNLWFAVGVMLFFLALSLLLGLTDMAWGGLFKDYRVVMLMAGLIFLMGLSLFGVFDLPVIDLKKSSGDEDHSPRAQSLFTGFFATLLATPCSGPLLGGVLGWTLTQPQATIAVVFAFIGLGMASPYLLLAARPELGRVFPRPGAWLGTIERVMAFALMATSVYLIDVLDERMTTRALILCLALALAAWIWGQLASLSEPAPRRRVKRGLALALACLAAFWAVTPAPVETRFQPFAEADFRARLGKELLVLDFTADWCPNCKVLEKTVLTTDFLSGFKASHNARFLQADLTRDNPAAEALLEALGSRSIPVVAIFPPGPDAATPVVLRDLFTAGQFEEAMRMATGK